MNVNSKTDIRTKIYQMFILGLEGEALKNNQNLVQALQSGLGGVIFFTQNIKTVEQFKKLIADIKSEAIYSSFLAIDQEGGRVERTENIFGGKKYLSASKCCDKGESFLEKQTAQIALELKDFGINLNFAPVLDVNTNPNNPIIGERAFSNDPDEVIKLGKVVVETYLKNGIIPCTKHFPGHGDANADSHKTLPVINLSMDELERNHIRPFKEVESPMIMVAHLHCKAFDEYEIPSSLSKNVVGYLREKLHYQGLIITDDMVMGGVLGVDSLQACAKAIKAGVNILLYRNSYAPTVEIIDQLAQAAINDKELADNIDASFAKIIDFKTKFFNNSTT